MKQMAQVLVTLIVINNCLMTLTDDFEVSNEGNWQNDIMMENHSTRRHIKGVMKNEEHTWL
jgi:hypothetical protein